MSLPLSVRSKLFWYHHGVSRCCWYDALGDGASVEIQNAYMDDMDRFGIDTATINICNEELSSPFVGEFMVSPINDGKVTMLVNFIRRLKERGKNVVIVFFDCPPADHPKYPYWRFTDRLGPFLEIATRALAPIADGFILGIETNRGPLSIDVVEYAIGYIRQFAFRMVGDIKVVLPVGTHEQNVGRNNQDKLVMRRRVPRNADFHGFETSNHPYDGHKVSVARMVEEVTFLANHSGGIPIWKMESNERKDKLARDQNNGVAKIPGVIGVSGVM